MSTHSTTQILDERGNILVNLLSYHDGSPKHYGAKLIDFLSKGSVVEHIGLSYESNNFNGMSCLAAQLVANFKKHIGDYYIVSSHQRERYNYEVSYISKEIYLRILDDGKFVFRGTLTDYLKNKP